MPLLALRLWAERSARSGWLRTPAGDLRYTVRGPSPAARAPQLLVVHGMSDSLAGWARAAAHLARAVEVHLIDLPGHGLSADPPDWRLATLVSAVEHYARTLDQPLVVGHSLGGWIALRLALRQQAMLRGLVLINPAGALVPAEELQAFLQLLQPRGARDVWRYLDRAFHRAPLALRLVPGVVVEAMNAKNARGFFGSISEGDFLSPDELRRIELPVRLLWGKHDRFLPPATFDAFRQQLPHAEVRVLDGCGHCPHLERPAELAAAIIQPWTQAAEEKTRARSPVASL